MTKSTLRGVGPLTQYSKKFLEISYTVNEVLKSQNFQWNEYIEQDEQLNKREK